jgi:DNA-binding NarL/FixJ family response regulator
VWGTEEVFAMSRVPDGEVRVLVVDDQEPFRRAMEAVVEETEGFVVVGSAATGEESLTAAAALRPQLVLMDVNLPGIDGIEASRRLTSQPDGPVVVLLSTYDADEFDVAGSGAAAYVGKAEFGPDRLTAAWVDAGSGADEVS